MAHSEFPATTSGDRLINFQAKRARGGKMKIKYLIMTVLFVVTSAGYAFSKDEAADTPENLIAKLYAEYQPEGYKKMNEKQRHALGMKFENREMLSRYFDDNLTKLFLKDYKCRVQSNEICNLDFDPVLGAQDYDEETPFNLQTKRISENPLKLKVTISNIGKISMVYEFSQTKNGCRISDIFYNDSPSLKKILSQ